MPNYFTKVFAGNLNAVVLLPIREVCNGDEFEPGVDLGAPGNRNLLIDRPANGRGVFRISTDLSHLPYRPSVDYAMVSTVDISVPSSSV
jgi:chemotaxis response regulator CheB